MKLIAPLLVAGFLVSAPTLAETSFTAVAIGPRDQVFAGLKETQKGYVPRSAFFRIDPAKGKPASIALPPEIKDREIIAILPGAKRVYVLTQMTVEQGDNPRLDAYDPAHQSWKKIGEVACPYFDRFKVEAARIVFHCEGISGATGSNWKEKSLDAPGESLHESGELKPPQTTAKSTEIAASLEGDAFHWNRLKIVMGKKERSVSVQELSVPARRPSHSSKPR